MKRTKKAKIRHFFLACLRWRYPRIRIQAYFEDRLGYAKGLTLRVDPNFLHYWQELSPGFNITVSIRALFNEMGVPKSAWDFGPRMCGKQYVHVDLASWKI